MMILSTLLCISVLAGLEPGQSAAARPSATPAEWEAVAKRNMELGLEGRHRERIAILEGWVKRFPDFADAHMHLGGAYESLGRDLVTATDKSDFSAALAYFERAIAQFRRTLDLGGGTMPDITIRALVDLLKLLSRPDAHAALVAEMVLRLPAEPRSHVELARWHLESGRVADALAALNAGRKAIPRTEDAFRDLAEGVWPDIRALPNSPDQERLSALVGELLDEALSINPGSRYVLMLKEEVLRDRARRSTDPARARGLLAEADRLRARRER